MTKKQEREPPYDLEGRYYDTLDAAEKRRYWEYIYGDSFTLEEAELLEKKYISGTLHFECTLKLGDIRLPDLDAWEAGLAETIDRICERTN